MEFKEYRTTDKSAWNRGPWDQEPDKRQWQDEATGLPCLIVRGPAGALCGYVGVPEGHPAHGKDYDDVEVSCHGGLTFARGCSDHSRESFEQWRERLIKSRAEAEKYPQGDAAERIREQSKYLDDYDAWCKWGESVSVCHTPARGEPDSVWWLGFDCNHSGDKAPARDRTFPSSFGESYKTWGYVEMEVRDLAKQLGAMTATAV